MYGSHVAQKFGILGPMHIPFRKLVEIAKGSSKQWVFEIVSASDILLVFGLVDSLEVYLYLGRKFQLS